MLSSKDCANIDERLWRLRLGDRSAATPLAESLIEEFEPGSLWHAVGLFHRAWARLHLQDEAACIADLDVAQTCFARFGERLRLADCIHVRALMLFSAGEPARGLAMLQAIKLAPEDVRGVMPSYFHMNLLGLCQLDSGDWDGALSSLTRAILLAEQTDDAATLGNSLANCAGLHCDMFNFDVAAKLAQRAWDLAKPMPMTAVWWTGGINAMLAYDGLGAADTAWEIARQLLVHETQIPQRKRLSYHSKFGFVALHAGHLSDAQRHIALAVQHCANQPQTTELIWARAQACIAQQQYALARELTEGRLAHPETLEWADTPLDIWRVLQEAAQACKGMQDFQAALAYAERASQSYVELVGQSARANRVAIEVELETQRTAWQRDEALRLHQEAQKEQQRLTALNTALDEASRAKSRLLAVASHDLRQPLHALGMYLASLQADLREHENMTAQVGLLDRAEDTVNALARMFGTLLDLSRLEGGGLQPNMQPIDLTALCLRLAQETATRSALPAKLLRAHASAAKFGLSDSALLERCLRNLLENAIQYAGDARLCLAIRARAGQWRIEVRDGGQGIAAEHQTEVFEEFYRIDQAQHTVRGLGLGLSIVKRLCGLLQHPLKLHSQPGRGTVVSIGIDRCSAPAAVHAERTLNTQPSALRIALIEDDPAVREGTAALLERWGYRVDCAADTAPWVKSKHFSAPDVAVIDYHLGALTDGMTALAELRSHFGVELPGLIVTAETSAAALERIRVSAVAYLPKPVQPSRLRAWLQAIDSGLLAKV